MPSVNPTAPTRVDFTPARPALPQEAVDAFDKQVQSIFHHDALSLARGLTPTREGDALTDEQRNQLAAATKNLILSLPVGALSPGLADTLQEAVRDRDFGGKSVSNLPLSQLGDVGQSIAKQFAADLKSDSPAAYYALAAASAGAIGYVAYSQGSDGLAKLGIKPEAKLKLFGDKLAVKARADFDPHFSNLSVTGSVTSSFELSPNARVNGQLDFDRSGVNRALVSASYARDGFAVNGQAVFNRDGFDNASIAASYTRDQFEVTGRATYDNTGRTTAGLDAIYRPKDNVELAASASYDSRGDARVGVGLRINF